MVNQWAIMVRMPSDLGFSDDRYILPQLISNKHTVKNQSLIDVYGQIQMFTPIAKTMTEVRHEQKETEEKKGLMSSLAKGIANVKKNVAETVLGNTVEGYLKKHSEDIYNLGLCYEAMGHYEIARDIYRMAFKYKDTEYNYAAGIGRSINNLGDRGKINIQKYETKKSLVESETK